MNCCDEYGDCQQGDNCPVRKELCEERMKKIEKRYVSWISDRGLGMLSMLGSSLFVSSMIGWGIYWLMHR